MSRAVVKDLLKELKETSTLCTASCNSLLGILASSSFHKDALKFQKQLAELVAGIVGEAGPPESLCMALLGRLPSVWLPVVLPYPLRLKKIIGHVVDNTLIAAEGELQVAAGLFLCTLCKLYPRKAPSVLKKVLWQYKRIAGTDSVEGGKRLAALATLVSELVGIAPQLLSKQGPLQLRSALLSSSRALAAHSSSLTAALRYLAKVLALFAGLCVKSKKKDELGKVMVPLLFKAIEYLEAVLHSREYAPLLIEMQRVACELSVAFSVFYPARRTLTRVLQSLRSSSVASGAKSTTSFDIRLSKSEQCSLEVARALRATMAKATQKARQYRALAGVIHPPPAAESLDGLALREAGLLKRLQDSYALDSSSVLKQQLSPASLSQK